MDLLYSPCPNDSFLFHALSHKLIDTSPFQFRVTLHDIATLNRLALEGKADLVKISCALYPLVQKHYDILPVGAALGDGHGPLLLIAPHASQDPSTWKNIGLPGPHTTATALARCYIPELLQPIFLSFQDIIHSLESGALDAGVIIHESRFTYASHGLRLHTDLGLWWQDQTGLPIPLGVLCVRNSFSAQKQAQFSTIIRNSLEYAQNFPEEVMISVRKHAQENSEEALKRHIELYVSSYTHNLGEKGEKAIQYFLKKISGLEQLK